ncbi:MAG: fimbrillin family protein [Rikenellaceae bacterium]
MKRKFIFAAILAASTFVSCNNEELANLEQPLSSVVTFGSSITRVTGNAFDDGDQISVVAFDSDNLLFGDATTYTYSDGNFASSSPIKLPEGGSLSYFASYPTQSGIDESFSFTIAADQNSDDGYEKSDLLVATVELSNSTTPTLQFSHVMSNLEITLKVVNNGVDAESPEIKDMSFTALNTVSCDISTGAYTGSGETVAITPAEITTDSKYSMILAPQTIAASSEFASITVDGTTYTWSPSSDIELKSGLKYEYTWTIDQTLKTSTIAYSGDINDWETGDVIVDDDDSQSDSTESGSGSTTIKIDVNDFTNTSSSTTTTFTSGNIGFCSTFYNGSPYIYTDSIGYLYNTDKIEGLSKVVITCNYIYGSFSVYRGSSQKPTGDKCTPSISNKIYTYTVTDSYINIKTSDLITIESIEFICETTN